MALREACKRQDMTDVRKLIQSGADVNARNQDGWTPLHWAASSGFAEAVDALTAAGADLAAASSSGQTPLHLAALGGHSEAVGSLLKAGSDPAAADASGDTPLHAAAREQRHDVVKQLLAASLIALGMFNKKKETPADLIRPQTLKGILNNCVLHLGYKEAQAKNYNLQPNSVMDAASEERYEYLGQVDWSTPLVSKLQNQWGLSTDAIIWLWRHNEQKQPSKNCDIVHPVDAVLARCLLEEGQSEQGKQLRGVLNDSDRFWQTTWKQMEDRLRSDDSEDSQCLKPIEPEASAQEGPKSRAGAKSIASFRDKAFWNGKALVINNMDFIGKPEKRRTGSEQDERALQSALTKLGFDVDMKRNLTGAEILAAVKEFAKDPEHRNNIAAVVAVLTHGDEDGLVGTDGDLVDTEDIIECLSNRNARSLIGKPKWIIFSACCTKPTDKTELVGRRLDDDMSFDDDENTSGRWVPEFSDLFISYATIPQYEALMSPVNGSFMLQNLCQVMQKYGQSLSLDEMHLVTQRKMMEDNEFNAAQTLATSQRGWVRRFYFTGHHPGDC